MTVAAGTPFTVNNQASGTGESIAIAKLDSNNAIAFYESTADFFARVIQDDETLGTEFTLSTTGSAATNSVAIDALSSTKAIVIYEQTAGAEARILSISGTTITAPGSDNNFSGSQGFYDVAALSSTSAVAVVDLPLGRAYYLTVSGTTITNESNVAFEAGDTNTVKSVAKLTSTKAVVAYIDQDDSNQLKAVVLSISGTTISAGSPTTIDSGDACDFPALVGISTTSALLVYRNVTDTDAKAVVLSGMSATTVTANTPIVIDSADIDAIDVGAFSATQFVATYQRASDSSGQFIELAVSGVTVSTVGSITQFDAGPLDNQVASVAFSASQVICSYLSTVEAVMLTLSTATHLWLSTDGAATFSNIGDATWGTDLVGGVVVVPGTAYQTIFAAVGTDLYKTTNGGTSWSLETAVGYEVDFIDLEKDNTTVFLAKRDAAGTNRASLWNGATLTHINTGKSTTGGATSGGGCRIMFIDIRNLQERRQARDSQFEGTRDIRNGYLFEVNGSVEGDREGLVWFKALDGNSEPFQVFYNGVIGDLRANMYVKIERNPKEPSRWQIIEFDTGIYFDDQSSYEQLPSLSMIPAKEDYEWPPGYPGAKALNIFPRAITDFAVRPTSPASMKARVYSGIYPGAMNYARFTGPVNTKDFTADIPGTAGLARLAAISIDSTGTLNYYNGTTFVDGLPMPDAALPTVPASEMLISAIRLVNGMTAIEESNFDLEMRPLMANGTVNVKVSEVWESDFGNVVLTIGATGQTVFQPAVDSTDFLQVLDADGGTPVLNVDSTNERVGIGTALPFQNVAGGTSDFSGTGIHVKATSTIARFILEGDPATFNLIDTGGAANDKAITVAVNSGIVRWIALNDDLTIRQDNLFVLDMGDGNAGFGTVSPAAKLESVDSTGTQLRLTHTVATKFADFTVDTNHDLTITPSSTGQVIFQPTTDSTDFFQVLDADGGTPILNVDSTNERVGIGTALPFQNVAGGTSDFSGTGIHVKATSTIARFVLEGDPASFNLIDTGGAANDKAITVAVNSGIVRWIALNDDLTIRQDNLFVLDMGDGNVGIGTATPISKLDVNGIITLSGGTGNIERDVDNAALRINAATDNLSGASISFFGRDHASFPGEIFFTHGGYDAVGGLTMRHANTAGSLTNQVFLDIDGDFGIGVGQSPQGRFHVYDAISGFIVWEYDGLDATVRTIIPNGTGDVLYRLRATYVMRDSAGAVAGATANVNNGASTNLTVGTNTVRLRVNADGSTDIARTAGTDTIKVALMLNWL